ncbi:hypothetical protein E3I90_04330 [Candidatus Bathyarchaeota archaeon]|nr:MAG: hypothetical protein E3I90_04330 [Candidatus Bathyarchaeota archaeon]
MNGKAPLIECKLCGLTIPKKNRREHLKTVHKISVGWKGWIHQNFRKRSRKHGFQKPTIIEIE